jgi:hypothetical protein
MLASVHEERDSAAGTLRFGYEDRMLDGPVEVGSHVPTTNDAALSRQAVNRDK